MSSFPVSGQHLSPASPPPAKYVSVSACTVWCPHHQLTLPAFLPHSHIYLPQPNFSSDLLSFHPQSHWFWKCLPVFLQSPCWLLCLTFLSSWFWFLFFLFSFSLVYFLRLAFVSSAFEVENFLSTLPVGPSKHKVGSWTAVSESIFGMAHRSLEVQLQGKPLSAVSDVPCMDRSLSFQL